LEFELAKQKQVLFRTTYLEYLDLKEFAENENQSYSEVIRLAIRQFLTNKKSQLAGN